MGEKRYREVYVLRLLNGMYYVGHTSRDINKVFHYHLRGDFVSTKNNRPVEIIEEVEIGYTEHHEGEFHVTEKRIEYMLTYGLEKVIGGGHAASNFESRLLLELLYLSTNERYKDSRKLKPLIEVYKERYPVIEQHYKREEWFKEYENRN